MIINVITCAGQRAQHAETARQGGVWSLVETDRSGVVDNKESGGGTKLRRSRDCDKERAQLWPGRSSPCPLAWGFPGLAGSSLPSAQPSALSTRTPLRARGAEGTGQPCRLCLP